MKNDFISFCVKTADEIDKINDVIHDEYYKLADINYDKENHILEIPFRRIFHDRSSKVIKNRLIYKTEEVDVLRCILRIFNVVKYKFEDKANMSDCSFNYIKYDSTENTVSIFGCEPCIFLIEVSDLCFEYGEIEYKGKARITRGLFWDSSSNKIYD